MEQTRRIINLLSDGLFHSGEELGALLGMSRSGAWKIIKNCEPYGLDIESVHGRGYRIAGGLEFLNQDLILAKLSPSAREKLTHLEIHEQIVSTNSYLLEKSHSDHSSATVILAEQQTAGRGRRGRTWISPFGKNIYFSLLWTFNQGPSAVAGLSLAVGVALVRALERYGLQGLGLKWPNDLLWQHRKLAGVLIEMFVDSLGACHVVIGVGLNLSLSKTAAEPIEQPWVDIQEIIHQKPRRNDLVALLIDELFLMLPEFEAKGLSPFILEWQALDVLNNQLVRIETPQFTKAGLAKGIDAIGGLKVKIQEQIEVFHTGEVSVKVIL